ncbi:MAG: hypothetical protein JW863_03640 [Chitinispirillaceae bacterium]|nr:hypothetical protein [Chitinispirillaceae bacterium]
MDSPDFTSHSGETGFNIYSGENYSASGILIEDCMFSWYRNNVIQGPGTLEDMVVRRCIITDNYDTSAHSQGLYTNNVSMLLEENVFDHNGWYKQSINSDNDQSDGQATIYNHNTYFSLSHDVTFRGNIFLRASSIGNKWTANNGEASACNIAIENNLYVEGEIGISMGGNTAGPLRFRDIRIADNVMLDIGRGQPTSRTLGWGIDIQEWDSGSVENNFILHNSSSVVRNVYAINLNGAGGTRNVVINGNTVYGVPTNSSLVFVKDTVSDCIFSNNTVWGTGTNGRLLNSGNYQLGGVTFSNNIYYGERAPGEWFTLPNGSGDINDWKIFSGETGSETQPEQYPDPDRTIESYNSHLGGEATFTDFINEVRKQSKRNWRKEYTAAAINEWIRAGFGISSVHYHYSGKGLPVNFSVSGTDEVRVFSINGRLLGTFANAEDALNMLSYRSMVIIRTTNTCYRFIRLPYRGK